MADRRRSWLVLGLGLVVAWGCTGEDRSRVESGPRMLDRSCEQAGECPVSGNVRRGEGITSDAFAYHLGPGGGRIEVPLADVVSTSNPASTEVEVLVRGRGRVALSRKGGPVEESALSDDPGWLPVPSATSTDGTTIVEAVTPTSEVVLLDLRVVAHYDVECSVSAPGARRRR